jgi:conflict system pore-forming effector with SLATT domain
MPRDLDDFPALFKAADTSSLVGQRQFTRTTIIRLGLAVITAVLAAFAALNHHEGVNVLGLVAAGAFTGALVAEIWLLSEEPEHRWYDNRALAESAKTLAWRYAVGGAPYGLSVAQPDIQLARELSKLLHDIANTHISPTKGEVVTPIMASIRASPLAERRESYIRYRILDQQDWYARKAERNEKRAQIWRFGLIGIEVAGVVASGATGLGYLEFDLTSIISTVLGVAVAWLAVKQHDALSRAYTVASHELALVATTLRSLGTDEDEWAAAVADAEEAISREHTMWRAARLVVEPISGTNDNGR